jgi:hypothetical protein
MDFECTHNSVPNRVTYTFFLSLLPHTNTFYYKLDKPYSQTLVFYSVEKENQEESWA